MKALGLVLTLAMMGCAAGPGRFATHDQQAYLRIMSDPTGHSGELYATSGLVLGLEKRAEGGTEFFVDGFGGRGVYAKYPAGQLDLTLGDSVSVLFRPLGTIDGVNKFGGPLTKMKVEAVAIRRNYTDSVIVLPGYESKAAAWQAGTLFAAK
jgi:hypothetical protein